MDTGGSWHAYRVVRNIDAWAVQCEHMVAVRYPVVFLLQKCWSSKMMTVFLLVELHSIEAGAAHLAALDVNLDSSANTKVSCIQKLKKSYVPSC